MGKGQEQRVSKAVVPNPSALSRSTLAKDAVMMGISIVSALVCGAIQKGHVSGVQSVPAGVADYVSADPWESLAGVAVFILYLSMAGNTPIGYLFCVFHSVVTDAQWASFCARITSRFGDIYPAADWSQGYSGLASIFGIWAIFLVWYPAHGLILLPLDLAAVSTGTKEYKIQFTKTFDPKRLPGIVLNIGINILLTTPLFLAAVCLWCLPRGADYMFGLDFNLTALPSRVYMLKMFPALLAVDEVLFFYGHWMLHHKSVYSWCHKIHHEFKAPIGLVAIYSHPFEMLVSNLIPFAAGLILFKCHLFLAYIWTIGAIMGTQTHHCGYRLPWIAFFDHQPNFHDFHHEKFRCNYGNIGLLDKLHGTDAMFEERKKETWKMAAKAAKVLDPREGNKAKAE